MPLIVQKFGGTSVASVEHLHRVAERVIRTVSAGHHVVVTVSAMGDETDKLIDLARSITSDPIDREYAALLATGEQVTAALLSMLLNSKGYSSRSYTGAQAGIRTNNLFCKARIMEITPIEVQKAIDTGCIPVITGFQGEDEYGNITTLGRGGSDTTAVAIAAALDADECQIYTDVDGVYTADPRMVPQARRLNRITFEEMLELASLGAKVLQIRAVEFAGRYNVPLRVMSSFNDGPGTLITYEDKKMEQPIVSGIAYNRSEAKITIIGMPNLPGTASKLVGPISQANIDIDMIVQNISPNETSDFTFTVHRDDYARAMEISKSLARVMGAGHVQGDDKIVKISLVGVGMRSHTGIASTMFKVLGDEGINMLMIATSEIKVSVVMAEKYLELGVRALHSAFGLDCEPTEEFDPTAKTRWNA